MIKRLFSGLVSTLASARLKTLFRKPIDYLLASANPDAPLEQRIEWITDLLNWIRIPLNPDRVALKGPQQFETVRLRYILRLLDSRPEWQKNVSELFASVLLECDALKLLANTGLTQEAGFFSEAFDRILRRVLPNPVNSHELSDLFLAVFVTTTDADWLEQMDAVASDNLLLALLRSDENRQRVREHFRSNAMDALVFLASQVEYLGLSSEIRERSEQRQIRQSAFFQLRSLIQGWDEKGLTSLADLQLRLTACHEELKMTLEHLESHGVSVAIVYRIEQIELVLHRIESIAQALLPAADSETTTPPAFTLVAQLIRDSVESKRLTGLIRKNLNMLSRKVIERAGNSGEHYITQTPKEYLDLLLSAGGGGALTGLTTFAKFFIIDLHAAPFFDGFIQFINYAGSFLLMQALHFTLATKQPSMTAPALAARLKDFRHRHQVAAFVDEVAKITRSQFAAAIGNIGFVIPSAWLIDTLYVMASGHHVVEAKHAAELVHGINPLTTLTIPFAALTGICLWLSSVAAGWFENWVVYRRLPPSIITRNAAGIAGNISLGFLLGFVPVLGRIFGIPIITPHVTLVTGSTTFSLLAVAPGSITPSDIGWAAIGIACIGTMNFGVSFALALVTALRARRIKRKWVMELAEGIWLAFRYKPLSFLLP